MADDWGMFHVLLLFCISALIFEDASSDDEVKVPKVIPKKKWEGEDEEENSAPVSPITSLI